MILTAQTPKEVIASSAKIQFDNREEAKAFATSWSRRTLSGHCMSSTPASGETTVTVYKLSKEDIEWINGICA